MDPGTLAKFDLARHIAGVPFVMTSTIRCRAYNRQLEASGTSSHLGGFAGDISVLSSRRRFRTLHGLIAAGFTRIGIGRTYIHADDDLHKEPGVIWLY